jgi:hypothetical protein
MIKTKIRIAYGVCSYGVAAALLLVPSLSSAEQATVSLVVTFLGGAFLMTSSVVTDFEMGFSRLLRFRESAFLTAMGSAVVLLSAVVVNYGKGEAFIIMMGSLQMVVAAVSYKVHYVNRHRLA